jgi:hypothetical protein
MQIDESAFRRASTVMVSPFGQQCSNCNGHFWLAMFIFGTVWSAKLLYLCVFTEQDATAAIRLFGLSFGFIDVHVNEADIVQLMS